MRLFEVVFVAACALIALVLLAVPRFFGAKHEFWPLFMAGVLMALAVGFAVHAYAIHIDRIV